MDDRLKQSNRRGGRPSGGATQLQALARFPEENPNPVLRVTRRGDVLYANPAACAVADLFANAQGEGISRLAPALMTTLRDAVDSGGRSEVELTSGGRDFSLIFTPIAAETYVNIYGRDITIRKRTIADLERVQNWLKAIAQHSPALIGLKDCDGRYLFVNRRFLDIHGLGEDEVIGRTAFEIFPPEIAGPYSEQDRQVLKEVAAVECEQTVLAKDFPRTHIDVKFPIIDRTGAAIAVGMVSTDITERKHMEEALRESEEQAEEASRAKSRFLANMSHELRTPMNAILGYTELITDEIYGPIPDKVRQVIERVDHNARHLLDLINDVLDLAKIEAGHFRITPCDYDPAELIEAVSATAEPLATSKGLDFEVLAAPDLPQVFGDLQRTTQAVLNLVGNAIKFTGEGCVRLSVDRIGDHLRISVSDTGIGISSESQSAIFEEFRQADDSDTREKGGTGLGLAIAKHMIELHGGEVAVDSTIGEGATFTIKMPLRAEIPEEVR